MNFLAEVSQLVSQANTWADVAWKVGTVVCSISFLFLKTQFVSKEEFQKAMEKHDTVLEASREKLQAVELILERLRSKLE